jgi:hypothetical protein
MKKYVFTMKKFKVAPAWFIGIFISIATLASHQAAAQIENVIVERYYVADANDATDTTMGRSLEAGSVTYRIFVDLKPGSKIRKIYGDQFHTLKIESTEPFYNNIDRPNAYFGFLLNKSWMVDNPTIGLDSWLTLGIALKQGAVNYIAVPKDQDPDGSFVGGINNFGGTAMIPGGLLVNNDPSCGIAVTTSDGYTTTTQVMGQWLDIGFKDAAGDDTTAFGALNIGSSFISNSAILQQNNGVMGADPAINMVLIGQVTTKGELSFELNLEIEQFDGTNTTLVNYVASNDTLLPGEVLSPYLKYPQSCGCMDPDYLEYSPVYACNVQSACVTPVVFGCMDVLACNYDPAANFNVQSLCCYPGLCNDRDLEVVCPTISSGRISIEGIFPVPVTNDVTFRFKSETDDELSFTIYDAVGKLIWHRNLGRTSGIISEQFDASSLRTGLYLVRLTSGNQQETQFFSKD